MPSRERVQQLIQYVEQGRTLEAIEEFYADDVAMQENRGEPTRGKSANLARERQFYGSIQLHEFRAKSFVVDGDRSAIEWVIEFTTGDGQRLRMEEVAYQTWRGDKIVHERFYYDTATLAAPAARAA